MAQVDFTERQLTLKLVYYGPPLSGKTSNLRALHGMVDQLNRGRLMTLDTRDDRTLFFVESGALSVHRLSSKGEVQIAIVNAGSVVGEGAFFSRQPRSASVTASATCRMWRLTPLRFSEMGNRQPGIALELAMALGLVMSRRLQHKGRRVAVT